MNKAPRYWDAHTSTDMKAHIYEYAEKCREAAAENNDADWMFFYGAREAVQRLLFLYRGRSEALARNSYQRKQPMNCQPVALQSCFACMGSGIHPQLHGGSVKQRRIDYLAAKVKRQLAKIKDPPSCPLCGDKMDYGVYIGSERVAPSCRGCQSSYGRNGFKTLKEAVLFMRGEKK